MPYRRICFCTSELLLLHQQLLCLILRSFFKNSPTKFLAFIKGQTKVKIALWKRLKDSAPGRRRGGGGGLPHKSDRDAHRLAWGCKLQTLASLRVFGMESYYICPFKCCLVLYIKKFTKNALTLTTQKSPLGVSLSLSVSHTHIGLH